MKIGFYFTAQKENGGIYQYTQTILKGLVSTKHEITVFNMSKDLDASVIPGKFRVVELIGKKNPEMKKQTSVSARRKVVEIIENTLIKTHFYFLLNRLRLWRARSRAQIIDKEKMDYVFFPNISDVSVTVKTPTIICVHDLQHRISPHFPEVSKDGQFSWRELTSKRTLERASLVIAESEVGKEYIQELYGTDPKMIRTLPYLPPDYLQLQSTEALSKIKTELELPETFFFYPGQLWPHKNHINLIKALIILKNKGLNPSLVLSGARKDKWGIYEKVTTMVKENGLENQVKYLGYVDNQTIGALYQLALGLVMPTFFGPSNIPILEAWQLNCPVIYSSVRGLKEQAGDAALLCDPNSPEEMAMQMEKLLKDKSLRDTLVANGRRKLDQWKESDFSDRISEFLKEIR